MKRDSRLVTCDWTRPLVASAAFAAALLSLSLPGHAQLFGGDDTARKQIAEQTKRIDTLVEQNDALAARLARIEESLKSLSAANPAIELSQQLERLRQEVMQLRGQAEVLGNEVQGAAKRQRDMYLDLDSRMKRLEQPSASAPAAAAPGPAAGAKPAPSTDAEARAYEAAQNQRRIGNYPGAIAAFQNFVAQYPASALAHRAQYWIGDSQYNLREFKSAIASQQKLIATWPDSASVPDALLNIASSQAELGNAAAARKTLDGLVARYPASEAAEKARRRLATLK
ncbi:MAG: tol-pal system protein YbgF [Betaproteobacteria bacterium]|nr:tol-pal system protein YbgF [Betaproteobacteria bacterium]